MLIETLAVLALSAPMALCDRGSDILNRIFVEFEAGQIAIDAEDGEILDRIAAQASTVSRITERQSSAPTGGRRTSSWPNGAARPSPTGWRERVWRPTRWDSRRTGCAAAAATSAPTRPAAIAIRRPWLCSA